MLNEDIKNKIRMRQDANMEILDILKKYFTEYPDIRFSQALVNLQIIRYTNTLAEGGRMEVIDPFNEESTDILERIKISNFKTN